MLHLSEEESSRESSPKNPLHQRLDKITEKIRPLRELTIQELLNEFGNNWKFQPNSISVGHFRKQAVMKFRRALYYSGVWVAYVQGYKPEKHFSASYFKRNPGYLQRLIPWLKRELTSVYGDYGYTVKNIQATILHHMMEYDLDSCFFINLLEPYLQQYTHQFLHEFISFVHSPYSMESYDERAIYQCPPPSPWIKKYTDSRSVVPFLNNKAALASQHNTKPSKIEGSSLMGLKEFPNVNSSLKKSESPKIHQETESKNILIKDKPGSEYHKQITHNDNGLLHLATLQKKEKDTLDSKKVAQQMKTEGIKWLSGHVHYVEMSDETASDSSYPVIFNQEQHEKYNLRERKALSIDQEIAPPNTTEKGNCFDVSPSIFQRRLPRNRSLISYKSRKRVPSRNCISENALSPQTDVRNKTSFRQQKMKYRQSSQFKEVGVHSSRRIQRQSRSSNHRSQSWCGRVTKRSVSRDLSNSSLREKQRYDPLAQNIYLVQSNKNNVYDRESICGGTSLTTLQRRRLSSTSGKRPTCFSKNEGSSRARSHSISPKCIDAEKNSLLRNQEIKLKFPYGRDSKTRIKEVHKNQCQCEDLQNSEKAYNEIEALNDIQQIRDLFEYSSSHRRHIQRKKENPNLQVHYSVKKGLETQNIIKQ